MRGSQLAGKILCWFLLAGGSFAVHAQTTKAPQQPLRLPDPTPRPVDLSRGLPATADPDGEIAKRQQSALAVQRQGRAQILAESDAMIALAAQLREHAAHPDGLPAAPLDRMAIQKIEQLAKDVRSRILAQ